MSLDVLLDPVTGDLPDIALHGTGPVLTAQRIKVRLETHLRDWKLDKDEGIDWISILGAKPVDAESLATTIAVEARSTPGVRSVSDLSWEQVGRTVSVSMRATADEGDTFVVTATPAGLDGNPSITIMFAGHAGAVAPG